MTDEYGNGSFSENSGMSDEEIQKAAANIGSEPYMETQYSSYTYSQDLNTNKPEKKKSGFKSFMKAVALALVFGIIAGGTFFGVNSALKSVAARNGVVINDKAQESSDNSVKQLGVSNLVISSTEKTNVNGVENPVVQVVKDNMSCTVAITTKNTTIQRYFGQDYSYESVGGGSGFIVGRNDTELLVATNNHVVESAKEIELTFCDNEVVKGTVRATDSSNDLAVVAVKLSDIKEDTLSAISVAKLGNSDTAEVGEMVIAIGNALGYGQSVTVGYLSAKNREVTVDTKTQILLQTDAAINGGNSGGPLFNSKGEVIGINCAKYTNTSVEGMCFAIPITAASPILNELMNREVIEEPEQGYLGIIMKDVDEDTRNLIGWPLKGVCVGSVIEGGAAEKAGIYAQDFITAVNGTPVSTTSELKSKITSYKYGTTIIISLKRMEQGKWVDKEVTAELQKKPENY